MQDHSSHGGGWCKTIGPFSFLKLPKIGERPCVFKTLAHMKQQSGGEGKDEKSRATAKIADSDRLVVVGFICFTRIDILNPAVRCDVPGWNLALVLLPGSKF